MQTETAHTLKLKRLNRKKNKEISSMEEKYNDNIELIPFQKKKESEHIYASALTF